MWSHDINNSSLYNDIVNAESGLSHEEMGRIRIIGDALDKTSVKLYGNYDKSKVDASGSHFPCNQETKWIYDKILNLVHLINDNHFQYELSGFGENFYYLSYNGSHKAHFGWHLDAGPRTPHPRKLSLVLQLSDPSEYTGGEFELTDGLHTEFAEKRLGMITAFPAFRLHRVKPVTSGIRRALVIFASGPNFR